MTEQEITNKEIYELECILEKVRKGGFMYTFAEAINDIENIFKPFMVQSAQITPEPGGSGQKRESPFIGEITISDLRKLFAHRASRISEDINQGANQLMTLTDFRLALADMRWRIYNDGLSEPGESGQSAEDVESIFYKRCDIARCDGASIEYLTKPNAIKAMHTYASHVCADKEREIAGLNNVISTMYAKSVDDSRVTMQIQSELDKANESLTVLLRNNDELLKSVRPEVVVPSEEWINGFKEEGRVASNWTIDKIKSLNPTLTFTELNHTAPAGDKSDEG